MGNRPEWVAASLVWNISVGNVGLNDRLAGSALCLSDKSFALGEPEGVTG